MSETTNTTCQNCSQKTIQNYCSNCGQKTDVDRFSIKYILVHDILHGIFHIDKGFPYTVKELFTRPGHSIREYINGKRIKHFHFFTFIIIALLLSKLISVFIPFEVTELDQISDNKFFNTLNTFLKENIKPFTFLVIPLQALISFIFFRKSKQNYSEHVVIASYISGAALFIDLLFPIGTLFIGDSILPHFSIGIELLKIMYSTWFFYQYFSFYQSYSKASIVIRSLSSSILVLVITYLLIGFIIKLIM